MSMTRILIGMPPAGPLKTLTNYATSDPRGLDPAFSKCLHFHDKDANETLNTEDGDLKVRYEAC
jgi:hypothetical protein